VRIVVTTLAVGVSILTLAAGRPVVASPQTSSAEVRFGVEVAKKGLWAEARFRFEKAVELDPRNAAALNNLAVACEEQGDFAQAREAYEQALKLKPGQRQIQQNYDLFREADDKRNRKTQEGEGGAGAAPAP
jgi:Flp pilus assembly protein TadD